MKIDRFINRCFDLLLGRRPDGEARLHFHSQNLNEDRNGEAKGLPWEGRFWLRTYKRPLIHFSWHLWSHFCGISAKADPEDGGTQFHIAFPPFSFWLTLPFGFKEHQYSNRNFFSIKVHDWSLWWQFGGDTMSWDSKTPKWKNGNFNFQDFFLGKVVYKADVVETKEVLIPMPEGPYPGIAKMERCVWKRPRWFALRRTSIWIDIPKGIPHEGKGENSWDCGKDGLFGCGVNSEFYEDAIAHVVKTAMKSRRKYDGNIMAKYPAPEAAHV